MTKLIIGLVLALLAGAGLWWSGLLNDYLPNKASAPVAQVATTTPQQQTSDLPTATNDASDAAIVQDSAAVDLQLQALSSDQASADQSLNDKPISQEF